jgi:hypothetical protein
MLPHIAYLYDSIRTNDLPKLCLELNHVNDALTNREHLNLMYLATILSRNAILHFLRFHVAAPIITIITDTDLTIEESFMLGTISQYIYESEL